MFPGLVIRNIVEIHQTMVTGSVQRLLMANTILTAMSAR